MSLFLLRAGRTVDACEAGGRRGVPGDHRGVASKGLARVPSPVPKPVLCPWQRAVGVAGGAEKFYHAIAALFGAEEGHAIVALGVKTAIGTAGGKATRDAVRELALELH
eukprot:11101204-Alexandrium_andersonii.AAC.1